MEGKSKNVILGNNSKDEIFKPHPNSNYYAVDKNGLVWSEVDLVDVKKSGNHEFSHYYAFVKVEKNEQDECYELYYKGEEPWGSKYAQDREGELLEKIDFNWLSVEEKKQIDKLTNSEQHIRLVAASSSYSSNSYMNIYHRKTVKYKYLLFLFIANADVIRLTSGCGEFDVSRSGVLDHTPLLDRLYLRMFFPEIYECEKRVDKKNDLIELNFYSRRKKILRRGSLAYISLLALSVVAMILINFIIFIIVASVLTVIFGFGLLYELKIRKIPYISELPQKEIDEIKKQIKQEKNKNKDQDQNKDNKDDKKEDDENLMEINTDSRKENKKSLIEKIENVNESNKKQEDDKSNKDKIEISSFINKSEDDNKKIK